ncbi:hypothetical protein Ddye_025370 [Dipteronia dyeriana]|uniref:Endonuclease/exonuclease/phosphatase domain-containing protein n=1 Tax=Dipteronia dyeriana TaxID=168575 RepID=A0AAD9WV46_9ROSI|nr:hypothetical protein Ddye_025370 [Dipteronia dyeriana]
MNCSNFCCLVTGSGGGFHFFMIILSWNVRDRLEKRKAVYNPVKRHRPFLLFIQETKLCCFDLRTFKSLGGSILTRGLGVEAVGSAGGLITLWKEDFFEVKAVISNDRCISVSGFLTESGCEANFCNVYAANEESSRIEVWKYILNAQASLNGPGVIVGDFNTVLEMCERNGSVGSLWSMRNFKVFID